MNSFLIRFINKINEKIYYLKGYILFGKKVYIENNVKFIGIKNIKIGNNCKFYSGSKIVANSGKIILEDEVEINSYSLLNSAGGFIHIKNNTTVGDFCNLYGQGGVRLKKKL